MPILCLLVSRALSWVQNVVGKRKWQTIVIKRWVVMHTGMFSFLFGLSPFLGGETSAQTLRGTNDDRQGSGYTQSRLTSNPTSQAESHPADIFNIQRLQPRTSPEMPEGITFSSFVEFPSKLFILTVFEHEQWNDKRTNNTDRLEVNVGRPINLPEAGLDSMFGWVIRWRYFAGELTTLSGGLQFNITDLPQIILWAKAHKVTSFLQLFAVSNNDALGDWDLLHYYTFPIYKSLYIRGYNLYTSFAGREDYLHLWHDLILPLGQHFDFYVRNSCRNRDDEIFGPGGCHSSLGVRINFSF